MTDDRIPKIRRVAVPGGRVALAENGGAGPPVVLLHGASGNLRDWTASPLWPRLASRRVVALDRPGFGRSDPTRGHPWRLDHQVAALRAALHAAGVRRAVLVGHSYSGALVLAWALRHPDEVAGLCVLSGATMDFGSDVRLGYRVVALPVLGRAIAAAVPALVSARRLDRALGAVFAPQRVPEGYAERADVRLALRPRTFRINARALAALRGQLAAMEPRYPEIRCPVVAVHGTADRVVPASIHAERLVPLIPGARLSLLDGVGHMPHHAVPEAVAGEILALG